MFGLSTAALLLLQILLSSYLSSQFYSVKQFPEFLEKKLERSVNSFHPRIAYGEPAPIEEFPYFASLRNCGAAIISNRWVVTAAHCVLKVKKYTIWVGGNSFNNSELVSFDKIIVHPLFAVLKNDMIIHDIALLRLTKPLTFGDKIQPIDLPEESDSEIIGHLLNWYFSDSDEYYDDDSTEISEEELVNHSVLKHRNNERHYDDPLVLVGRGIDETDRLSKKLMKMNLNRLPLGICFDLLYADLYSELKDIMPFLNELFFCGVRVENLLGIGPGDSGSPVAKDHKLVGITSFAIFSPGKWNARVGFYVNVAFYVSWIKSVINL